MGSPAYMYKVVDGVVSSQVFDSDDLPKDWHESPEKALASEPVKKDKGAKDGDSKPGNK